MKAKPPKAVPAEQIATREEIDQAIERLTEAELVRLQKFAAWRIRGLGRGALRREGDDLLSEALTATIAGAEGSDSGRRWNKKVDFIKHLLEAMRSISHHWKEQFDEQEARLESEILVITPEGEETTLMAQVETGQPDPERILLAKEEVGQILKMFEEDDEAILVLEGWVEGMTGPEIVDLGLTPKQYEAAVKRIRYAARPRRR